MYVYIYIYGPLTNHSQTRRLGVNEIRHDATTTGWWLCLPTPLKNDGVKVSWDDDIPNWMDKEKMCSKPGKYV